MASPQISHVGDSPIEAPIRHSQGNTRIRYCVLLAACGLAIVGYIHRVGFARALLDIQKDYELTSSSTSYILAAFFLGYGLFEVPWGVLGDKLGVRHMLAILVLGWSILTGAVAWVRWFPSGTDWPLLYLVALRFVFGGFQAGMFPAISRMIADWMPTTERGTAQGLIWMSSRFGGAAAPRVTGAAMRAWGGLHAFWYLAVLGFAWIAAFWPWFRNRPAEMKWVGTGELERISAGRPKVSHGGHLRLPWKKASRSLSVWSICAMYGCLGFTGNFFIGMLPVYLNKHRGFDASMVETLTSLPLACGIISCLLGGSISDLVIRRTGNRTLGRRSVAMFGLLVACLALASTAWVHSPFWLGFLLCLTFFANDLSMGPAWAACADIGEQYAGTLGGTMNMVGSFTAAVGAVIAGRMLDAGQARFLLFIFAGAYLFGAIAWMGIDVNRRLGDA